MIQVNRIYLIFNRLVTKKFLVDTSEKNLLIKAVNGRLPDEIPSIESYDTKELLLNELLK